MPYPSVTDTQPETIETSMGPVGLTRTGEGPPVLMIHGSPGGWDSSLVMGRFLVEGGHQLIAPSRPGYPGTPLDGRTAIDQQADVHAALLEALGIESAGVLTWSGGGPSGYRLAVRHPEKVSGLVAFASVSQAWHPPDEDFDTRLIESTTFGNWILNVLAHHAPKTTISATLAAEGDLTRKQVKELVDEAMADERQSDVVLTMAEVMADHKNRVTGLDNDIVQFGVINDLELEKVQAPTLVIHGSADTDVPPAHGDHAAATIPGAEHLVMDQGTHLSLFVHPEHEEAQARALAKLAGPAT